MMIRHSSLDRPAFHGQGPQPPRYPLIEPLRGIAAVWVVIVHASVIAGASVVHGVLGPVLVRPFAFHMFFVMTGLLLYRPFVKARLSGVRGPELRPYLWRRAVRLLPAYWIALTVTALVVDLPEVFTRKGIVAYYGLMQVYSDDTVAGGLPQAWTLCILVVFYLALPLWALLMSRLPLRGGASRLTAELVGVGVIAAASLAFKVLVIVLADPRKSDYMLAPGKTTLAFAPVMRSFPAYADHLALGMGLGVIAAAIEVHGRAPGLLERLRRAPGVALSLAAVLSALVVAYIGTTLQPDYSAEQFLVQHVVSGIAAALFVLPALAPGRTVMTRALDVRPLRFLGKISYGIFLWHIGVLLLLWRHGWGSGDTPSPFLLWLLPTLAAAVALGTLTWYGIERPIERLHNLARTRRRAGARVTPAGHLLRGAQVELPKNPPSVN